MTISNLTRSIPSIPNPMPDPDLIAGFPDLAKAAAELDRLGDERSKVRASLANAKNERRAAEHADIGAQASAIRAGKPDPARTVPDVDEKIAGLERRAAAVAAAQEGAAADLAGILASHRSEYLKDIAKRTEAQRRRLAEAVEVFADERFAVAELESLATWIGAFAERPRGFTAPSAAAIHVTGPLKQRGEGMVLAPLLETMRADAIGPRAREDDEAA